MSFDIVTIGSATVDHFADTDSEVIKIDTRHSHEELIAFPLGSKLLINELKTTVGGGGTNTAVAFSHLGLKTGYLGKLGEDAAGDYVLDLLKREHIEFIGVREGQTGFSVILNSIEDDRTILAFKGANDHLRPHDIPEFQTQWLYISSMLGESWDTVVELVAQRNVKVAFNPSNYQADQGYQALAPLIDKVHILIMNREEACKILGRNYHDAHDPVELIRTLHKLPPAIVVITDAAVGAYAFDGENLYHGLPRADLKIVETTGAGDAFAATFTAATIKGCALEQALDLAMTNAESVLQHKGAKEVLLHWDELVTKTEFEHREIVSLS